MEKYENIETEKGINIEEISKLFLNEDLPENIKTAKSKINDMLSLLEYFTTSTYFEEEVEEKQYVYLTCTFSAAKKMYFDALIKYARDSKRLASHLEGVLEKLQAIFQEVRQICKEDISQSKSEVAIKLREEIMERHYESADIILLDEINYAEEVFKSAMQTNSEADFITYVVLAEGIIEKLNRGQNREEEFYDIEHFGGPIR